MARKSRKVFSGLSATAVNKATKKIPTAIYARLSVENSGNETDETLQNQIAIVENYVAGQSDLELVETYIDNGFTGTKFDRPDFNRMLNDVKCGRISCIVVKDLSRFGRDYLEAGYYIETVFPLLNVRFIAINDNFDSSNYDDRNSLSIPVKNMVNAMYSKDYSHKIGISVEQAKEERKVYGNCESYGYKLDKELGKLVIDKDVEPYVRMIFSWSVSGVSSEKIAKRLNLMNIPTPSVYYGWQKDAKWHSGTISRIVRNPVYGGYHVMNKSHKSLYHGIKFHNNDETDWIMTPNAHESYLTDEEYEILADRRKEQKCKRTKACERHEDERNSIPDVFNGKVYCSDCGRKLLFIRKSRYVGSQYLYGVYGHSFDVKPGECSCIRIQNNLIKSVVVDRINELISSSTEISGQIKGKASNKVLDNRLASLQRKKSRLEEKITSCDEKSANSYADSVEKIISVEEYKLIKRKMDIDKNQAQATLAEVEAEINEILSRIKSVEDFAGENNKLHAVEDITPFVVSKMIERIEVNDKDAVNVIFKKIDFKDLDFVSELFGIKET